MHVRIKINAIATLTQTPGARQFDRNVIYMWSDYKLTHKIQELQLFTLDPLPPEVASTPTEKNTFISSDQVIYHAAIKPCLDLIQLNSYLYTLVPKICLKFSSTPGLQVV